MGFNEFSSGVMLMKRWYGLLLPFFFSASFLGGYAAPQDRQYVDYFLRLQAADLFRKKSFLLNWSCAYVNSNRLLGVDLSFSCYRALSLNQARKLLVEVAEEIVEKINSDPSLHERNLLPEPFTLNQIYLKIETDNIFSYQADMETIQSMYLDCGNITYNSYPASTLFYGCTTKYKETLEQARMFLGEKVLFGEPPVPIPNDRGGPLVEAAKTLTGPPKSPTLREIESPEEPTMNSVESPESASLDYENMLGSEEQQPSENLETWKENLLGDLFEKVAEVFPNLSFDAKGQRYRLTHIAMPPMPFPETYAGTCEERWEIAALPEKTSVPLAAKQSDIDKPLTDTSAASYNNIAVSSSPLPEIVEDANTKYQALCWNEADHLPRHGGENLVNSTADESLSIGLMADPNGQEKNDPEDDLAMVVDSREEKKLPEEGAIDAKKNGSAEVEEGVSPEPWYKKVSNWLKGTPEVAVSTTEEKESSLVSQEDQNQERAIEEGSDAEQNGSEHVDMLNVQEDQSALPLTKEAEPSDSQSFFKRIWGWLRGNTKAGLPTDGSQPVPSKEGFADMYEPTPVNTLAPPPSDAASEASENNRPMQESSQAPAQGTSKIYRQKGLVPPPELIDETKDDTDLESSSDPSMYQKVLSWLQNSNESLSSEADEESNEKSVPAEPVDEEPPSDDTTPWYKSAMALFRVAPRDRDEQPSVASANEGENTASDCEQITDENGSSQPEESLSLWNRFTSWIHGTKDDQSSDVSNESSQQLSSSPQVQSDPNGLVAERLGEVERPDQAWEDIENEMQNDEDGNDGQTDNPGFFSRAASGLHSFWKSITGESTSKDNTESLDDSTASCSPKEADEPAEGAS